MIQNPALEDKIKRRFEAYKNLLKIAFYHGVHPQLIQNATYQNHREFAQARGLKIINDDRFVFELDTQPINFLREDGSTFHILYIEGASSGADITKAALKRPLADFLIDPVKGLNRGDLVSSRKDTSVDQLLELIQGSTNPGATINTGIQLILYSENRIESTTNNLLTNYNTLIRYPIKHFTIEQLQYDPTVHITAPRIIRALTDSEKTDLIKRQIGLKGEYGIDDLGAEYLKEMNDNPNNIIKRSKAAEKLTEHVLSKLPTMNSTDPWIKWRGFRIGDILYIERKVGPTLVCYRRVVKLDKEVYDEARTKTAVKIKTVNV